jgi:hypothetical protein
MEIPPILIVFAALVVSGIGLGIAVLWEAVNSHRDRKAVRDTLRRVDDASRTKKEKPGEPVLRPGVWDRELDR